MPELISKIELNKRLREDERTRNLITDEEKKEHGIMGGKNGTRQEIIKIYNTKRDIKNRDEALRRMGFKPDKRRMIGEIATKSKKK